MWTAGFLVEALRVLIARDGMAGIVEPRIWGSIHTPVVAAYCVRHGYRTRTPSRIAVLHRKSPLGGRSHRSCPNPGRLLVEGWAGMDSRL